MPSSTASHPGWRRPGSLPSAGKPPAGVGAGTASLPTVGRRCRTGGTARPPAGPSCVIPAVLKLFLGADPRRLAAEQVPVHRRKIEEYETLMATIAGQAPPGQVLALTLGIAYERAMLTFWQDRE